MPSPQTDLLNGLTGEEAGRLLAVGVPGSMPAGGVRCHQGDHAVRG